MCICNRFFTLENYLKLDPLLNLIASIFGQYLCVLYTTEM